MTENHGRISPGCTRYFVTGSIVIPDPFADSAEAVTAYEDGRFGDLVVHNVADVLRTRS